MTERDFSASCKKGLVAKRFFENVARQALFQRTEAK